MDTPPSCGLAFPVLSAAAGAEAAVVGTKVLPPGWKRRTDFGKFKGYVGPQGRKVQTVPLAWAAYAEMHAEVQAEAQAGAQPTEGGAEGGAPLMAGARVMACYGGGAAWYAGAVAAVRALG